MLSLLMPAYVTESQDSTTACAVPRCCRHVLQVPDLDAPALPVPCAEPSKRWSERPETLRFFFTNSMCNERFQHLVHPFAASIWPFGPCRCAR